MNFIIIFENLYKQRYFLGNHASISQLLAEIYLIFNSVTPTLTIDGQDNVFEIIIE